MLDRLEEIAAAKKSGEGRASESGWMCNRPECRVFSPNQILLNKERKERLKEKTKLMKEQQQQQQGGGDGVSGGNQLGEKRGGDGNDENETGQEKVGDKGRGEEEEDDEGAIPSLPLVFTDGAKWRMHMQLHWNEERASREQQVEKANKLKEAKDKEVTFLKEVKRSRCLFKLTAWCVRIPFSCFLILILRPPPPSSFHSTLTLFFCLPSPHIFYFSSSSSSFQVASISGPSIGT